MLKPLLARPERLKASVSPMMTKPARLSRLKPEMMSFVSIAPKLPRFPEERPPLLRNPILKDALTVPHLSPRPAQPYAPTSHSAPPRSFGFGSAVIANGAFYQIDKV